MATDKRIPKQNITYPAPAIFAAGSVDEAFLAESPDARPSSADLSSYGKVKSFYSSASLLAPKEAEEVPVIDPEDPDLPKPPITPELSFFDVPSLVDIESITFEESPDPLTGISKYNAIIKIRNSSKNKSAVSGVDARIYNPNSPNAYNFSTTTAASGSSSSTVVPKTTWYNAQSKCNPFSGVYVSSPSIVGTAQYQADGKDVPADSTSGPSSARIKSVWRKTFSEALEAAKNSSCEIPV